MQGHGNPLKSPGIQFCFTLRTLVLVSNFLVITNIEKQYFLNDFVILFFRADLYDDDAIQQLIKYQSPWINNASSKVPSDNYTFTDDERMQLVRLPHRNYILFIVNSPLCYRLLACVYVCDHIAQLEINYDVLVSS